MGVGHHDHERSATEEQYFREAFQSWFWNKTVKVVLLTVTLPSILLIFFHVYLLLQSSSAPVLRTWVMSAIRTDSVAVAYWSLPMTNHWFFLLILLGIHGFVFLLLNFAITSIPIDFDRPYEGTWEWWKTGTGHASTSERFLGNEIAMKSLLYVGMLIYLFTNFLHFFTMISTFFTLNDFSSVASVFTLSLIFLGIIVIGSGLISVLFLSSKADWYEFQGTLLGSLLGLVLGSIHLNPLVGIIVGSLTAALSKLVVHHVVMLRSRKQLKEARIEEETFIIIVISGGLLMAVVTIMHAFVIQDDNLLESLILGVVGLVIGMGLCYGIIKFLDIINDIIDYGNQRARLIHDFIKADISPLLLMGGLLLVGVSMGIYSYLHGNDVMAFFQGFVLGLAVGVSVFTMINVSFFFLLILVAFIHVNTVLVPELYILFGPFLGLLAVIIIFVVVNGVIGILLSSSFDRKSKMIDFTLVSSIIGGIVGSVLAISNFLEGTIIGSVIGCFLGLGLGVLANKINFPFDFRFEDDWRTYILFKEIYEIKHQQDSLFQKILTNRNIKSMMNERLLKKPFDVVKFFDFLSLEAAVNYITSKKSASRLGFLMTMGRRSREETIPAGYPKNEKERTFIQELEKAMNTKIPLKHVSDDFDSGMVLDETGTHVLQLKITRKRLSRLPSSVQNLTFLNSLILINNDLWLLPESTCSLVYLEILDVSKNKLEKIPEQIGNLKQLRILNLAMNRLTTLPETLGHLSNLQKLNLEGNQLRTIPNALTQLTTLQEININYNTGLKLSLLHVQWLAKLKLDGYKVTVGVENIRDFLKKLEVIMELEDILKKRIPLNFERIDSHQLGVWVNKSTFRINGLLLAYQGLDFLPESIGNLHHLEYLSLSNNQLTHLPESIIQLDSLSWIDLRGNPHLQLTSRQARWLVRLKQLKNCEVLVDEDVLSQLIKESPLLTYQGVQVVHKEFDVLKKLERLLGRPIYYRTGSFNPNVFGFWVDGNTNRVISLVLDDQQLISLQITLNLEDFQSLRHFSLKNNKIQELPESLGTLRTLRYLDLSNNHLTSLPESIVQLDNLDFIDLRYNLDLILTPRQVEWLVSLKRQNKDVHVDADILRQLIKAAPFLHYRGVRVTHENYDRLRQLERLLGKEIPVHLDMPFNPTLFGVWIDETTHEVMGLSLYNQELDRLPDFLIYFNRLQYLSLRQNHLDTLDSWIKSYHHLCLLDLEKNHLISLPASIGDLTTLRDLNLRQNRLSHLPETFGKLLKLRELNLSGNQLTVLPDSIVNLEELEHLDLSDNPQLEFNSTHVSWIAVSKLNGCQVFVDDEIVKALLDDLEVIIEFQNSIKGSIPLYVDQFDANKLGTWIDLETCRVTGLVLFDREVTTIPSSIGRLKNLRWLILAKNRLMDLPETITHLNRLELLDLRDNPQLQLNPSQLKWMSALKERQACLVVVDDEIQNQLREAVPLLRYHDVSIAHGEFDALMALERLLKKPIPCRSEDFNPDMFGFWIGDVDDTRHHVIGLSLCAQDLKSLPKEIANLLELRYLSLRDNELNKATLDELKVIANFTKLRLFDVSNNHLTRLPESIIQLTNLEHLDLRGNPQLQFELVQVNWIASLKEEQGCLVAVDDEILNQLREAVPLLRYHGVSVVHEDFDALMELERLLKKPIPCRSEDFNPDMFGFWIDESTNSVVGLSLSDQGLQTFPDNLKGFRRIQQLSLRKNNLTTLPKFFESFPDASKSSSEESSSRVESNVGFLDLKYLDLEDNDLSSIPRGMSLPSGLQYLNVAGNDLKIVSNAVCAPVNLKTLNLSKNQLTTLPDCLVRLTNLQHLDLSDNPRLGFGPTIIQGLVSLRLQGCQVLVKGTRVESLFKDLEIIQVLQEFIGQSIPMYLGKETLDASRIGFWVDKETLNLVALSLPDLTVESLPEEISGLRHLKCLFLRNGAITALPGEIIKLDALEHVDLRGNSRLQLTSEQTRWLVRLKHQCGSEVLVDDAVQRQLIEEFPFLPYQNVRVAHEEFDVLMKLERMIGKPIPHQTGDFNPYILGFWINDRTHRVIGLSLHSQYIESFPDILFHLQELRYLALIKNYLKSLPELAEKIDELRVLYLSDNLLSKIPESFGQLANLQLLDLSKNRLVTFPNFVIGLTNLQHLDLSDNPRLELDTTIIQGLVSLRLQGCQVVVKGTCVESLFKDLEIIQVLQEFIGQSIPMYLGKETLDASRLGFWVDKETLNLVALSLPDLTVESLPEEISGLRHLKCLFLRNGAITALPGEIIKLDALEHVDLRGNSRLQLTSEQTRWLVRLKHQCGSEVLVDDAVQRQLIEESPFLPYQNVRVAHEEFDVLMKLERMIGKPIPRQTGNFKHEVSGFWVDSSQHRVNGLALFDQQLNDLPDNIKNLRNLEFLSLNKNGLTAFPPVLKELDRLLILDLSNNQISQLSPSISELKNLQVLLLDGNDLEILPEAIGNLSHLSVLSLSNNQLKKLPYGLINLSHLESLNLLGNPLTSLDISPLFFIKSLRSFKFPQTVTFHADNVLKNLVSPPWLKSLKSISFKDVWGISIKKLIKKEVNARGWIQVSDLASIYNIHLGFLRRVIRLLDVRGKLPAHRQGDVLLKWKAKDLMKRINKLLNQWHKSRESLLNHIQKGSSTKKDLEKILQLRQELSALEELFDLLKDERTVKILQTIRVEIHETLKKWEAATN